MGQGLGCNGRQKRIIIYMITVNEAVDLIQSTVKDYGIEQIPLSKAIGRVLRENLYADRPFPPFNRVAMDGIALQHQAFANGQKNFVIEGIAPAGAPQITLQDDNKCLEVMTGAVLPLNTDTVIRYEDLTIENDNVSVNIDEVIFKKNVHQKGKDRQEGELLVQTGKRISPAEINVAATIGKTHLSVSKHPKVIIISTGDELVDTSETPLPHQIRKSNVYLLQSMFANVGIDAVTAHLNDDYEVIRSTMQTILQDYDLVIMSGGVSMGKFDFLPKALQELNVKQLFHKVKQRPGKPLWFGVSSEETVIFALPGNPVSSFACALKYVFPWLRTSLQIKEQKPLKAQLKHDFSFKPDLTYFLQVKVNIDQSGTLLAEPVTGNGSGDLANLADANGFLELPTGKTNYLKGEVFHYMKFRDNC